MHHMHAGGQKKALDLELQVVVLGTKPQSTARAGNTLNAKLSPAPTQFF